MHDADRTERLRRTFRGGHFAPAGRGEFTLQNRMPVSRPEVVRAVAGAFPDVDVTRGYDPIPADLLERNYQLPSAALSAGLLAVRFFGVVHSGQLSNLGLFRRYRGHLARRLRYDGQSDVGRLQAKHGIPNGLAVGRANRYGEAAVISPAFSRPVRDGRGNAHRYAAVLGGQEASRRHENVFDLRTLTDLHLHLQQKHLALGCRVALVGRWFASVQ